MLSMSSTDRSGMEHEKIERLRDRMLQCPICIDEYKDPRILPCHHTVCLSCLMNYIHASSSSGRLFRCPQCRADVCVPRGGVKDFPPNFYINCIQDEIGSKPYFGICDVCERDWLVSQYRCVDCDLDICKFCVHDHKLFKHMSGRQANIMRIETGNIGTNLTSERFCDTHKDESLQMFCNTCDVPICVTCICDSHKKHDTMTMTQKLQLAQRRLQAMLNELLVDIKEVKSTLTQIHGMEKTGDKSADEAICHIQAHTQEVVQRVRKIADSQIETIKSTRGKYVKEIRNYETELAAYLDHLQRGSAFLGDLQTEDMSIELFSSFLKYKKVIETAQKSVSNKKVSQNVFSFMPGKILSKLGYLGVGRSTLQKQTESCLFLPSMQQVTGVRKYMRCIRWSIVIPRMFFMFLSVCMLTGFVGFVGLFMDTGPDTQTVVCLLMYTYVCLAGAAAYYKS